jgi:DNA repair exonuclease SbcCD ATPase subunit
MEQNQLVVIVKEKGLQDAEATALIDRFSEVSGIVAGIEAKAREIKVTDETQVGDMELARSLRLELKAKRVEIEKTRKQLKEESLRKGQAIDGVAGWLKDLITPVEKYLDDQEHFVENKRKAEEEARRAEADRLLREKEEREAAERAEAEARQREEDRKAREAAEAEAEKQRKAAEAAQRKAEAERKKREEAEARAKAEREEAERKARAEQEERDRKAREKHEAELKKQREKAEAEQKRAVAEAEARARKEAEEAAKKAATVKCPHCGQTFDSREAHVNG